MAEGNDINEMVKVEDGDDCCRGDQNDQSFVLLLRVTQANGKLLPIGGFTGRTMAQMLYQIAGVIPKEVVILTDQEVVMTLEEEASMMEVSRAVHGLCQQQMMEILEKVSDQVKKVENICSGTMPALEGEYYTPPGSQMRLN